MKKISDCCKKEAYVSTADEGTSCHMCTECKRPCDLFVDPIDNNCHCKKALKITHAGLCNCHCEECRPDITKEAIRIYKEEYERLKRLHDNVKKCINELEGQLACHLAVSEETQMLENVKTLLEDLCK